MTIMIAHLLMVDSLMDFLHKPTTALCLRLQFGGIAETSCQVSADSS
ncbi:hypothetical protein LV828_04735 [[Clostridium] innocuum]|nr:hypothetical protein [[Clostridium] innocuum]MBU9114225.1 hypothetical protein [[Clostridium] innocuum]MCI2982239.1 hypothetical protein [[Clostridium] innocuum]